MKLTDEFKGEKLESHIERTIEAFRTLRKTENRDCFCKIVMTKGTDPADVLNVTGSLFHVLFCSPPRNMS